VARHRGEPHPPADDRRTPLSVQLRERHGIPNVQVTTVIENIYGKVITTFKQVRGDFIE
jgi:hypothetical protein